ncbi:MAG: hypothetical protein SVK44_08515 [Nitrospirota bacterium]|nr:hypothetical protein [Nitrospirota bacterium]
MYDLVRDMANPISEILDNWGLQGLTESIGITMGNFTDPLRDFPLLGPLFFEPLDAIADAFRWKLLL